MVWLGLPAGTVAKQNETPSAELFFTQVQNQVGEIFVHLCGDDERPAHSSLVVREDDLALEPQLISVANRLEDRQVAVHQGMNRVVDFSQTRAVGGPRQIND